jgi:hypothetical protein
MADTCNSCGGNLGNIFDLANANSDSCVCNVGGLVPMISNNSSLGECCVESVNGKTGVVVLNINDIDLLGNQFFSNSLVYAALSGTTPIVFNPSTGNISHANSAVTAGTYGSSSVYPIVTVDAKGHVTSVQTQALPSTSLPASLVNLNALSGTGYPVLTGTNTWALRTIVGTSGRITVTNQNGVAANTQIDLAVSGVTAGTYGGPSSYPIIQVDSYGRITSASTQAVPTAVIPVHTHSLGSLSNVNPSANAPTTNQVLTWNGSQWVNQSLPTVVALEYELNTVTLINSWTFAGCRDTVDAGSVGEPMDLIQKMVDANGNSVVYLNFCVHDLLSNFPAPSVTTSLFDHYFEISVATLPVTYRPIHTVVMPLSGMLSDRRFFEISTNSDFDTRNQYGFDLTAFIRPNGDVSISVRVCISNYDNCQDSTSEPVLIVPIVGCFATKDTIVEG